MTNDLERKLKNHWKAFTTSEQKIATYLLHNLNGLPFETAASLSKHVDVSAMTVGRFLRKLGYVGVDAMKHELRRDPAWLKLYESPLRPGTATSDADAIEAEMRILSGVYALARSAEWKPIVRLLASSSRVSIASFQLGRFLGITFATLLQHVRPNVVYASGSDGAYADILIDSTATDCVVLIDKRRYSRYFRILAEQVAERGVPLIILTDTQCYWASQLTPHVLMVPIDEKRAWHSFGALSALFSLLLNGVVRARQDGVLDRIEQIEALHQTFLGPGGRRTRKRKPRSS